MKKANLETIGYVLCVLGLALVLLWISIFKFTPTEAMKFARLDRTH